MIFLLMFVVFRFFLSFIFIVLMMFFFLFLFFNMLYLIFFTVKGDALLWHRNLPFKSDQQYIC